MTEEQARIVLLEQAVEQAQSTIEFLHGCLTHPSSEHASGGYRYAYPEQTERQLRRLEALAPRGPMCVHSFERPGCEACESRVRRAMRRGEALEVLGLEHDQV